MQVVKKNVWTKHLNTHTHVRARAQRERDRQTDRHLRVLQYTIASLSNIPLTYVCVNPTLCRACFSLFVVVVVVVVVVIVVVVVVFLTDSDRLTIPTVPLTAGNCGW